MAFQEYSDQFEACRDEFDCYIVVLYHITCPIGLSLRIGLLQLEYTLGKFRSYFSEPKPQTSGINLTVHS